MHIRIHWSRYQLHFSWDPQNEQKFSFLFFFSSNVTLSTFYFCCTWEKFHLSKNDEMFATNKISALILSVHCGNKFSCCSFIISRYKTWVSLSMENGIRLAISVMPQNFAINLILLNHAIISSLSLSVSYLFDFFIFLSLYCNLLDFF